MEPSVRSFAGPSAARRDRSDPVMITDALADVRVKYVNSLGLTTNFPCDSIVVF